MRQFSDEDEGIWDPKLMTMLVLNGRHKPLLLFNSRRNFNAKYESMKEISRYRRRMEMILFKRCMIYRVEKKWLTKILPDNQRELSHVACIRMWFKCYTPKSHEVFSSFSSVCMRVSNFGWEKSNFQKKELVGP